MGVVKAAIKSLKPYTNYPTMIGLSDVASADREGLRDGVAPEAAEEPRFPWMLVLRPTAQAQRVPAAPNGVRGPAAFREQLRLLAPGTPIYDVFAATSPDGAPTPPPIGTGASSRTVRRTACFRAALPARPPGAHPAPPLAQGCCPRPRPSACCAWGASCCARAS